MTKLGFLNIKAFGILELILTTCFAVLTYSIASMENMYGLANTCIALWLSEFVLLVWYFFNKKKARMYFITATARMYILTLTIAVAIINKKEIIVYIVVLSVLLIVLVTLFDYMSNRKKWVVLLEKWKENRTIDFENQKFRIAINNGGSLSKTNLKKTKLVLMVVGIGIILIGTLERFFEAQYYVSSLELAGLVSIFYMSLCSSKLFSWTVHFIRMENRMKIRLKTEFADKSELARLKRKKMF